MRRADLPRSPPSGRAWKDGKLVREESAYARIGGVKAIVIDRDENRDLALLMLESLPDACHGLKVADAEPEEGDTVRMIGGFTLGGKGVVWGAVRGEVRTVGPVFGWNGNTTTASGFYAYRSPNNCRLWRFGPIPLLGTTGGSGCRGSRRVD